MHTDPEVASHALQVQPAKDVAALMCIHRLIHFHHLLFKPRKVPRVIAQALSETSRFIQPLAMLLMLCACAGLCNGTDVGTKKR